MFNESLFTGIIALIIMFLIGSVLFPSASIAKRIDDKFQLKSRQSDVATYKSSYNTTTTLNKIKDLKRPKDIKLDNEGNNFLLYEDYIVVLKSEGSNTDIEVMRHSRARNRYRGPIINYWGGSLRSGSIGRSSTRGGGFGFGK